MEEKEVRWLVQSLLVVSSLIHESGRRGKEGRKLEFARRGVGRRKAEGKGGLEGEIFKPRKVNIVTLGKV